MDCSFNVFSEYIPTFWVWRTFICFVGVFRITWIVFGLDHLDCFRRLGTGELTLLGNNKIWWQIELLVRWFIEIQNLCVFWHFIISLEWHFDKTVLTAACILRAKACNLSVWGRPTNANLIILAAEVNPHLGEILKKKHWFLW